MWSLLLKTNKNHTYLKKYHKMRTLVIMVDLHSFRHLFSRRHKWSRSDRLTKAIWKSKDVWSVKWLPKLSFANITVLPTSLLHSLKCWFVHNLSLKTVCIDKFRCCLQSAGIWEINNVFSLFPIYRRESSLPLSHSTLVQTAFAYNGGNFENKTWDYNNIFTAPELTKMSIKAQTAV